MPSSDILAHPTSGLTRDPYIPLYLPAALIGLTIPPATRREAILTRSVPHKVEASLRQEAIPLLRWHNRKVCPLKFWKRKPHRPKETKLYRSQTSYTETKAPRAAN